MGRMPPRMAHWVIFLGKKPCQPKLCFPPCPQRGPGQRRVLAPTSLGLPIPPPLTAAAWQHPWGSLVQRDLALLVLVTSVRSEKNQALVAGGELRNDCSKAARGYGKFDG